MLRFAWQVFVEIVLPVAFIAALIVAVICLLVG
jgi:hypothetical protein